MPELRPDPPWAATPYDGNNAKIAGWHGFFDGTPRERCPFPPARTDLLRAWCIGWDAAKDERDAEATCMCGDPVDAHSLSSNHGPVSMADYRRDREQNGGSCFPEDPDDMDQDTRL